MRMGGSGVWSEQAWDSYKVVMSQIPPVNIMECNYVRRRIMNLHAIITFAGFKDDLLVIYPPPCVQHVVECSKAHAALRPARQRIVIFLRARTPTFPARPGGSRELLGAPGGDVKLL